MPESGKNQDVAFSASEFLALPEGIPVVPENRVTRGSTFSPDLLLIPDEASTRSVRFYDDWSSHLFLPRRAYWSHRIADEGRFGATSWLEDALKQLGAVAQSPVDNEAVALAGALAATGIMKPEISVSGDEVFFDFTKDGKMLSIFLFAGGASIASYSRCSETKVALSRSTDYFGTMIARSIYEARQFSEE